MNPVVALILVSSAMILVGILVMFFDRRKRGRCTEETEATIVGIRREINMDQDSGNSSSYYPVFRFTAGGATVEQTSNLSSSRRRKFKEGDVWQVRYNPEKPDEFYVVGVGGGTSAGIILIILGIVVAGFFLASHFGLFG